MNAYKTNFKSFRPQTELMSKRIRVRRWFTTKDWRRSHPGAEKAGHLDGWLVAFCAQPFADNTTEILAIVIDDAGEFHATQLPYIESLEVAS